MPDRAWLDASNTLTRHDGGYWTITVDIPEGERSKEFTLDIENDLLDEPDGDITVEVITDDVLNPSYGLESNEFLRVVAISDNDVLPPPAQVYANGNVIDEEVSIWWTGSTGATRYQLRYAVETCPNTAVDEASVCTISGDWNIAPETTGTSIQLSTGSGAGELAISDGAYSKADPSGVYRLQVRAINKINRTSPWSTPAFVYPSTAPPVGSKTLESGTHSRLPIIATAHLYGYQLHSHLAYIVCDETIPTGLDMEAADMENAIKTWSAAVHRSRGNSLISADTLVGPIPEDACEPPEFRSAIVPDGGNAVMFVNDKTMEQALCLPKYTLQHTDPRGCWRSRTPLDVAWRQIEGSLTHLLPITPGTILVRNAPVPNGLPSEWEAPGRSAACNLSQHVIAHETGHAFGIGRADSGRRDYHPRNSTLSVMSAGHVHNTEYCGPQAYDIVTLTALYQSR